MKKYQLKTIKFNSLAVTRFTGYQKEGRLVTVNSVLIFGGLFSSIILIVAWVLSHLGILTDDTHQTVYAMSTELAFWLIVSFIFGVVVWNHFEIPYYILPSLDRIPMRAKKIKSFTRNFAIIVWIGIYSGLGIFVLCTTFISLAMLPFLVPGFQVPQWIVVWAQFALVVFYSIIIIRFVTKPRTIKALLIIFVVLAYVLLKFSIPSLGLIRAVDIKQYADILLTFFLTSYFFYKLFGITCSHIKKKYVSETVQKLENKADEYLAGNLLEKYNTSKTAIENVKADTAKGIIPLEMIKNIGGVIIFLITVVGFLIALLRG